jgi:hypothetical protein
MWDHIFDFIFYCILYVRDMYTICMYLIIIEYLTYI